MHAVPSDIPVEAQAGDVKIHGTTWGDISVRHVSLPAGADLRPLLAGLPNDRCACEHYGVVLEGSITVEYADGTLETTRGGEVYCWPEHHTGWTDDGVVFVEFSPAAKIAPVLAHVAAKMAAVS